MVCTYHAVQSMLSILLACPTFCSRLSTGSSQGTTTVIPGSHIRDSMVRTQYAYAPLTFLLLLYIYCYVSVLQGGSGFLRVFINPLFCRCPVPQRGVAVRYELVSNSSSSSTSSNSYWQWTECHVSVNMNMMIDLCGATCEAHGCKWVCMLTHCGCPIVAC
jgi:hypothetical protein